MRNKFLVTGAVILSSFYLLILYSCNRNSVTLSFTNAKGEVPLMGNLNFRFSNSLVKDSLLEIWDSTEYISFEPAIKGRFRWNSPDELVFSPSQPLDPATDYKASVNSDVLRYTEFNSVKEGDKIKFHTPALSLEESLVTWIGESSTNAAAQIELYFNYPVDPSDLKDRLKLQVEGRDMDYTSITQSASNKIAIRIIGLKTEDKDLSANITINKGLKPFKGSNASDEDITTNFTIPSPYVLLVQDITAEHDGTEGIVTVITSQQLTSENLRPLLKIDPDLTYTVEPNENGFVIRSDKFDVEKSYSLTIAKGLRGKIGGVLKEDYQGSIAFGELEAGIRFTNSKAVYLSKNGASNVEVQITNVPKVKLIISKIYESNLLLAQQYGYYPQESNNNDEYYEEGYEDYNPGSALTPGDIIYEKEINTAQLPKSKGGRLLNLASIEDRLPELKGIYHISIRSLKDYWVSDSRFISLSDLGLIAKEGDDKIFVFANSIKTATPVSGATIAVYGSNNQLIGTGAANKDGVAEIAYTKKDFKGFKPAMIIAKTADDFNYLPFNNTRVNLSRFDVGGKRNNAAGLDAFIYAERDIYRPGEKLNFSVIVRDRQWKTPGDIPLKLKVLMPNGKELKTFRKSLNDEGAVDGSVDITTAAITGAYTLEVYSSTDVLLASKNFSVEEFVPDRIRVTTKLSNTALSAGSSATLSINAVNFFGPPAANRNYETEIQVKQKAFIAEKFSDYDFNLANQSSFFDKVVKNGTTDASGNAVELYEVPATYNNMGILQTNFYTTVFDETGRPVSRAAAADIFTQPVFYGIKFDSYYYHPLNQPVTFSLASVNMKGQGINSEAHVQVIKHEYNTVLAKSGSYFRYESQKVDKLMIESNMNIGSSTAYNFIPRSPGDYEIRVSIPGANTYVSRSFYSYGSWGGDYNSFEVSSEGNIDIEIDKKSYSNGESVNALFKTPFNGKMLVTMETDHVISYQYVDVTSRTAKLNLKLTGDHVPNVYITATLIKPHAASDIPLTVAHGFQNVQVEEKSRKLNVEITSAKQVRSKTKQTVTVKSTPGSYITLAAVDNGVLQVSDFKTPDPYNYFYQKKALQVAGYDLYPLLFAELRARMSSTGGDGELNLTQRVNPMPAKRIKVLSYWSGMKKTNGSGEAKFDVEIPQFSGEIRLMAVSFKGQSFGAADNTMTVADPIVISTALPRFLSPGDTLRVPVTLTNTTAASSNITATVALEGTMKVLGSNTQSMTINPKTEATAVFDIVAGSAIGIGKVKVQVNGAGEKFEDVTEIGIRPPSTLQKLTGSGSIDGGSSKNIAIGLSDFMPGSSQYSLVVSRSPMLELGEQLKYLIQYPYGCTEQTISSAFPQLYYGDLADLMQSGSQDKAAANSNIIEAIRKIKLRQLYNGAVTLWDAEGKEDWWTSVYAAHFLLEARKAGFDVDANVLDGLLSYMNNRLKSKQTITYYYNRDQNRKIAPKEVTYSLYVLAIAGRTNVPAMNYYKSNPNILALDSRYLLSAAFATAGDKRSYASMLPANFIGEQSVPQTGGSYYSDVRDESIALNALLEVDPSNAQIPIMSKHVVDKLKSRRYLSTQERSFALLALGKIARRTNESTATAEIKVNGKTIANVNSGQWKGDSKALNGTNIQIVTKGTGKMYYYWMAEGVSASGAYTQEDNYIKVRRKFYDRNGKAIIGNTFKQNDLIIVSVTVEKAFDAPVENVVLTDLLPAGFEIENPRTKEIPGMDWIKDGSTPTSLDVRDDRIHFFVDVIANRQTYYYAVRAVSPGRYRIGPASGDAMYNGEYHSYNGAGVVRVIQ